MFKIASQMWASSFWCFFCCCC